MLKYLPIAFWALASIGYAGIDETLSIENSENKLTANCTNGEVEEISKKALFSNSFCNEESQNYWKDPIGQYSFLLLPIAMTHEGSKKYCGTVGVDWSLPTMEDLVRLDAGFRFIEEKSIFQKT